MRRAAKLAPVLLLIGASPDDASLAAAVERALGGDPVRLAQMLAPDFRAGDSVSGTPAGYVASYGAVASAFSGLKVVQRQVTITPDGLELRLSLRGRNVGWLGGKPPTQRVERFVLTQRFVMRAGQVAAATVTTDLLDKRIPKLPPGPPDAVRIGRVEEVGSFQPGSFPEGLAVRPDGSAIVSMLFGRELWIVPPGQAPRPWVKLPFEAAPPPAERGLFCLAAGPDGEVYASVAQGRFGTAVWRVELDGRAREISRLPAGTSPNGIAYAPGGRLYVADTFSGVIWSVDTRTGGFRRWLDHSMLKPRPFKGTFPGVNGLQTDGRHVYATVSDTALVIRVRIRADGAAGRPELISDRIAGDDFALLGGGRLAVTTHPFNTLEEVGSGGRRVLVAGTDQGMVGPTTAARLVDGSLLVATDGGLYAPVAGRPPVAKLLKVTMAPEVRSAANAR